MMWPVKRPSSKNLRYKMICSGRSVFKSSGRIYLPKMRKNGVNRFGMRGAYVGLIDFAKKDRFLWPNLEAKLPRILTVF